MGWNDLDAFNAGQVIRKRLLHCSMAVMLWENAIELAPLPFTTVTRLFGEADLLEKSVNGTLGGSLMLE